MDETPIHTDSAGAPAPATPTVVLGVSAGIAAYKSCELVRLLTKAGMRVQVVMTPHATELVGPATFRSLTGNPVAVDLYDAAGAPIHHISLADAADIMVIAPATANVIAKLAHGTADDLLTTTALTYQGTLVVAPAMNTQMYLDAATQENLQTLRDRGVVLVGPVAGELACGTSDIGRMSEPSAIADAVGEYVPDRAFLSGRTVLVSAGPTREPFDPVRYLTNRSSGRMGYALAQQALRAGAARVVLVSGPVNLARPVSRHDARLEMVPVTTTAEMRGAVLDAAADADVILCAAAVADYRPRTHSLSKIKKYALSTTVADDGVGGTEEVVTVQLVRNPDILAELGQMKAAGRLRAGAVLVGFAAETDDLDTHVREKLATKGADWIVANDVSRTDIGFDAADNEVRLLGRDGADIMLPRASKALIARSILETVVGAS
ncbi:MAG: bifunctional phosphopantothenoylcysteine decarboxylase/phosphopantothenate--cysteine ligase CoaBC [Actinomycetes bacterium]|jgi:phosphopantothenoylcysteine decarboxylase/phosphopantothenate--cysteine ligase|nr:bifunctional phosphopantothenoylcysteine decarboxylase/phosphopantothenate--cysteine ligase CoaBC [Actinomycetes bacterium]